MRESAWAKIGFIANYVVLLMRAGWGEGVRPSRTNEQKGTFQPGMKTPNSTKSRAAQCIPESYVALLMRMCIAWVWLRSWNRESLPTARVDCRPRLNLPDMGGPPLCRRKLPVPGSSSLALGHEARLGPDRPGALSVFE